MSSWSLLPKDDPKQAHRIRRYLMAVGTSCLALSLMFLLYWQGHFEEAGLVWVSGGMLFFFALFYALFRTGLNKAFPDPSLTIPQMLCAFLVLSVATFSSSSGGRGVLLLVYFMAFAFGMFRLGPRPLGAMALIALASYVAALGLALRNGGDVVDERLELVRAAAFGVILFWFALMCGYINTLRRNVMESKAELERAFDTIQHIAARDELTGLHNRRSLMDLLQLEKARSTRSGTPFCVCMIDLDFFKDVNDTLGHLAGDEVLKAFARNALLGLRATDHFGRYGGEEFMLVLPQSDLEGARARAERLRLDTERLRFEASSELRLTVSIGIAQYRVGEDVEQALELADLALYRAKQAGRNRTEIELPHTDEASAHTRMTQARRRTG